MYEEGSLIFGARVKKLLKERRLERKDLVIALNLPVGTVNNYIEGRARPSLWFLEKVADFFGVSVDHLIAEEVNEDELKIHMIQRAYTASSPEDGKYIMGMVKMMLQEIEGS